MDNKHNHDNGHKDSQKYHQNNSDVGNSQGYVYGHEAEDDGDGDGDGQDESMTTATTKSNPRQDKVKIWPYDSIKWPLQLCATPQDV